MIDFNQLMQRAAAMKQHYGSARPREILEDLDIGLLEISMGDNEDTLKGFIQKNSRMITVGINTDLPEHIQDKVLLHEIGHYKQGHLRTFASGMLGDTSFRFRHDHTFLSKLENEANFFASEYLLDTEETLAAIRAYDLFAAARSLRVPVEFLDYKLRLLHQTGRFDAYRDQLSVRSDCMRSIDRSMPDYDIL